MHCIVLAKGLEEKWLTRHFQVSKIAFIGKVLLSALRNLREKLVISGVF